jgi:predicted Zn-dependent protease
MSFAAETRALFDRLAEDCFAQCAAGEEVTLSLSAEEQAYLRFNASRVRQSTNVRQRDLGVQFQLGGRRVDLGLSLGGDFAADARALRSLLARAREEVKVLPEDPFLVPMENRGRSEMNHPGRLLAPQEAIRVFTEATEGTEFTGLFASGPMLRASCNSLGQSHWFATESFFIDYSLYTVNEAGENKAVKECYAGNLWSEENFLAGFRGARERLGQLRKPSLSLQPGGYRAYLAPAATRDFAGMMGWGALSYSAWKRGLSAFAQLQEGKAKLSPQLSLRENFALGLTPQFNALGEMAPVELALIERGELRNLLVGARSAREYGVPSNGAEENPFIGEAPRSPEIIGGELDEAQVLESLGTGVYLGNLHYLNWSDRHSARVTGMTRYACFWVERGEIVSPIRDMRFDETLYRALGANLVALTRETRVMPETWTYFCRSLGGMKVPGMLIDDFRFTL